MLSKDDADVGKEKRCCENCGNLVCATSMIAFHWDDCVDSDFKKHWRPRFVNNDKAAYRAKGGK